MTDPKATAMVLTDGELAMMKEAISGGPFVQRVPIVNVVRLLATIDALKAECIKSHQDKNAIYEADADEHERIVAELTADLTTCRQETEQARARIAELENDLYLAKYSLDFYEGIRMQALSASLTCEDVAKAYWDAEDSIYKYDVDSSWARVRLTECLKRARIDGALPLLDRLRVLEGNQRIAGIIETCAVCSLVREPGKMLERIINREEVCEFERCPIHSSKTAVPIRRAAMAEEKG